MKTIVCSVVLPCFFLFFLSKLHAQRSTELGIWGGTSFYLGDLAPDLPAPETLSGVGGLAVGFGINPFVFLRLKGLHGELKGSDAFTHNAVRDWSFRATLSELSLQIMYHPLGKGRKAPGGYFRKWQLSPYLFWGMGASWMYARRLPPSGETFQANVASPDLFLINLPMGAGLRLDVSGRLSLSAETGWRLCFSDQLDGVHELGRPDTNDWYVLSGIGISWILNAEVDRNY